MFQTQSDNNTLCAKIDCMASWLKRQIGIDQTSRNPIPPTAHTGTNSVIQIINRYLARTEPLSLFDIQSYENQINTAVLACEKGVNSNNLRSKISRGLDSLTHNKASTKATCAQWDKIQKRTCPDWRRETQMLMHDSCQAAPIKMLRR